VQKWGEANGVKVTVDHINLAEIPSRTAAEISAGQGHDLIEWIAPPSQFEPSVLDLGDVVKEAEKRYGNSILSAAEAPTTRTRRSSTPSAPAGRSTRLLPEEPLGEAGKGSGPETWEDLISYGGKIKKDQGIQLGIGLSQELDSNMAARGLLWSYDTSIQDKKENVVLNNPKTVEAVSYMARLFKESMVPEVFAWTAVSNNQALIAGRASTSSTPSRRTAPRSNRSRDRQGHLLHPASRGPAGRGSTPST